MTLRHLGTQQVIRVYSRTIATGVAPSRQKVGKIYLTIYTLSHLVGIRK